MSVQLQMEGPGRSVDRSREISIKKPRITLPDNVDIDLEVDVDKERGSPMLERMRAIERERERERRSLSILENDEDGNHQKQKQKPPQSQPQQELVNQYKTALGELVFNSKPIITNLTIIAGENKRFAKEIAATVCSHILEVPNDQKLPSLYLLDSIVKNIGGDYVKYFAARLPEVFCKAYRWVDPSIHPGMQHLFRTWRRVFPLVSLRIIEEQLQFSPSMNGSSPARTTPRTSDNQSQRPGHSIHVNPKYLEARQQLQESNRAEKVCSENNGEEPVHESDRPETSINASLKGWSESPRKRPSIQHQSRNDSNESEYGQKISTGYGDYNYGMDPIRSSDMVIERPDERLTERDTGMDRSWYGERENSITSVTYNQRNSYDWQKLPARGPLIDAYGNFRGPKSAHGPLLHVHPSPEITNRSRIASRNWQNSEEEEYMWEDMSARSGDHDRLNDKPRKFPGDIDKPLGLGIGRRMGPEPDLPDGHWRTVGPLVQMDQPLANKYRIPGRGLDDRLALPPLQHDIGAQSSIEASMENSNILRTNQNTMVQQSLPNWPQKHLSFTQHARPRMLPVDLPNRSSLSSINAGHSEGLAISSSNGGLSTSIGPSSVPRLSFRTNNGIGTRPPGVGALPHVTPISSGLPSGQRQSSKPPSPSKIPSIQQLPGSPTSAFPRKRSVQSVQNQQQNNLIRADDLDVHNQTTHPSQLLQSYQPLSQGQKTHKPQTSSDSLNQLTLSHVQSGHSMQLQMSQTIQPLLHFQNQPTIVPPQQGHPVQFLRPVPTETLLPQIQPVSLSQPSIPAHALQQPDLRTKVQPSPPRYGPPQTLGYISSGISTNPSSLQGQTNTQNLIDAILKSGILPTNSIQTGSNSHPIPSSGIGGFSDIGATQPPLPSGPPPVQFSAATMVSLPLPPSGPLPISTPVSSHPGLMYKPAIVPSLSSTPMLSLQPQKVIQPPLPPGPPPSSSLVAPTLQATSSVTTSLPSINPVSNLLNSLVAQGLISAPTESASSLHMLPVTSVIPNQLHNYSMAVVTTSISQASVCAPHAGDNPVHSTIAVHTSASAVPSLKTSGEAESGEDLIGHDFTRERILEHHPFVISALYDVFPRQCKTCGLRFMSQDERVKHMDWHISRVHVQKSQRKLSRLWYACVKDWLGGGISTPAFSFSQEANNDQESNEPAVPSDENQAACALCGEVFEEIYNDETEEWMFKGTVHLNAPSGVIESKDSSLLGPIVHAKCRSDSATLKLGDSNENGVDDDILECRRKTMDKSI